MDGFRTSPRPQATRRQGLRACAAGLMLLWAGAAMAQADATIDQVYQAAREGQVAQAQRMMAGVLRQHPNSAKAHYVEAELLARQGQFAKAREELHTAEQLAPTLPFARADAVQALQRELALPAPRTAGPLAAGGHWGIAAALAAGALMAWLLARLGRPRPNAVPAAAAAAAAPTSWPGPWGTSTPAPAPAPAAPASGLGQQIAGGLATGLAAGAGVVAAEAIAHRLLDGPPGAATGTQSPSLAEPRWGLPDTDPGLGGADFGILDPGSWDAAGGAAADGWDDA